MWMSINLNIPKNINNEPVLRMVKKKRGEQKSRWVIKPFMNICIVIMSFVSFLASLGLQLLIKSRNLSASLWWNFYHDSSPSCSSSREFQAPKKKKNKKEIEHKRRRDNHLDIFQIGASSATLSSFERHREAARVHSFLTIFIENLFLSRSSFELSREENKNSFDATKQSSKLKSN